MTLKSLYEHFRSHPEGMWIMKWPSVVSLYEFIKGNDVRKILALGTGIGCSDAVIALAMREKGEIDYHIDSIEQYRKCIDLAEKLIPEDFLKHIVFHESEPDSWSTDKIPCQYFSVYGLLPNKDYDLILNDGPSLFMKNGNFLDLPNGTIHKLLLEDKIKPGTKIAYDGRIQSFNLLERFFSDNFYHIFVPDRKEDFFVIERKANELCLKDSFLERMKINTTYFKNNEQK